MEPTRHAFIELRIATADDFKTPQNQPKWNAVYFQQSCTGMIEKKLHYLTPETDKETFKELFEHNQIWVFATPDEVAKMCVNEEELEVII